MFKIILSRTVIQIYNVMNFCDSFQSSYKIHCYCYFLFLSILNLWSQLKQESLWKLKQDHGIFFKTSCLPYPKQNIQREVFFWNSYFICIIEKMKVEATSNMAFIMKARRTDCTRVPLGKPRVMQGTVHRLAYVSSSPLIETIFNKNSTHLPGEGLGD